MAIYQSELEHLSFTGIGRANQHALGRAGPDVPGTAERMLIVTPSGFAPSTSLRGLRHLPQMSVWRLLPI